MDSIEGDYKRLMNSYTDSQFQISQFDEKTRELKEKLEAEVKLRHLFESKMNHLHAIT